uniref:class II fructose-bisphosphate aldolase n=1 Tax=Ndongobacter massiliensis TaxID=1871025 RepID=UPI000932036B|nr:class II fructose-bisphosphate aldolase [Ndongobacter massiliensis]
MLVDNGRELLLQAKKGNYAIPAYDFIDLDSARVYCQVAEELNKPLILSFAEPHKGTIPLDEAAWIGKFLAKKYNAPIVLHLDHGSEVEYALKAIELGFTSVMLDASMQEISENIRMTREVAKAAHAKNVQVEAELGHVGSNVNGADTSLYTQPEEAAYFVKESHCDSLAISIGTSHGVYKMNGLPKLNFEVLQEIAAALPETPLVLHGGSGSGDENLARCAKEGICKLNIFTDLIVAANEGFRACDTQDYLEAKSAANEAMMAVARHYYRVCGTK